MKLHEDLIKYNHLTEKTMILQETYHTEGLLGQIVKKNMDNIKNFGGVIKDVAKLVGNDIGYLSQFLNPMLKSIDTWDKRRENYNNRRTDTLRSLKANLDSFESGDALVKLALNPGAWCFGQSMKLSPHHLLDKENRVNLGKYGLDKVPVVGWFFESTHAYEGGSSPWKKFLKEVDPENPDPEAVAKAFSEWAENPLGWAVQRTQSKPQQIWNIIKKAQKLFLITDGLNHDQELVLEGEEEEIDEEDDKELEDYPELMKMVIDEVTNYLEKNWPLDRNKYIQDYKNFFDEVIEEAAKTIGIIGTLSSTEDDKLFFKSLKELKKAHKSFDIDVTDLESKFKQSVDSIKENEETMAKIKDTIGEEEPTNEMIEGKIASIVLTGFKTKFLQGVKDNLAEFYEAIYNEMTEDTEEEELKDSPNKYDTEYYRLTIEYRNKLTDAISKFKQS